MAPLLGVPDRHRADYGRLGLAFQHANFIRDVREDFELDRIYLPRADRERFGVADEDFGHDRATPALRALVAHEVRRARELFRAAAPAVAATPAAVRPGVRLACAVYESVLDRVEAAGHDVLGRRTGVRISRLPAVAWGALRP
jgi:phytoene synthase